MQIQRGWKVIGLIRRSSGKRIDVDGKVRHCASWYLPWLVIWTVIATLQRTERKDNTANHVCKMIWPPYFYNYTRRWFLCCLSQPCGSKTEVYNSMPFIKTLQLCWALTSWTFKNQFYSKKIRSHVMTFIPEFQHGYTKDWPLHLRLSVYF